MAKAKLINESIIEPELLSKILGYKTVPSKQFVDQVNSRLAKMETDKQEKADMINYFNKMDNIPKANLDTTYTQAIDTHMSHKIDFNDLDISLSSRINGYENTAKKASDDVKNLTLKLENTLATLNIAKTDITNIYSQLTVLQTFGSSSSGSTNTAMLQSEIDSLSNEVTSLNSLISSLSTTIAIMQSDSINYVDQSSFIALQSQINAIDTSSSKIVDLTTKVNEVVVRMDELEEDLFSNMSITADGSTPQLPAGQTTWNDGTTWFDTKNNSIKHYNAATDMWDQFSGSVCSSSTSPVNPQDGDIWFDSQENLVKIFNISSNKWEIFGNENGKASSTSPVNPQDGDIWFDRTSMKIKMYNDTTKTWIAFN